MSDKEIREAITETCIKLKGEIELKKDFYKQLYVMFNFLNRKIKTIFYIYDYNLKLLWINGKNNSLIDKDYNDLKEMGYNRFIEGYHPEDNEIIKKRKHLLESGEPFEIMCRYKDSNNEYEPFLVHNFLLNPEAKRENKLYLGEVRSLKNLYLAVDDDEMIQKLNSREYFSRVFKDFTECQQKVMWAIYNSCGSNKEIAASLFIDESTVKSHKRLLFILLHVKTNTQLLKLMTNRMLLYRE